MVLSPFDIMLSVAKLDLVRRTNLLGGSFGLSRVDAQLLCESASIFTVRLFAEANPPQLDFLRHTRHRAGGVGKQPLLLVLRHQAEQVAGLSVVVIARVLVVAVGVARYLERRRREYGR